MTRPLCGLKPTLCGSLVTICGSQLECLSSLPPVTTAQWQELRRLSKRVLEFVRMFAVGDLDFHRAGETSELIGTGIWYDGDAQLGSAPIHGARVLQREHTTAVVECSRYVLHRHVTGRAWHGGAHSQHLTLARCLKVAMKLIFKKIARQSGRRCVGGLRSHLYFKRATGVCCHQTLVSFVESQFLQTVRQLTSEPELTIQMQAATIEISITQVGLSFDVSWLADFWE